MDSEIQILNPMNKMDYLNLILYTAVLISVFSAGVLLLILGVKSSKIILIIFIFLIALGLWLPFMWIIIYLNSSIKSIIFQKNQFILHFRGGKKIPIAYDAIRKIERENHFTIYCSELDFDITTYHHKGVIPSNKLSKDINNELIARLRKNGKRIKKGITL